MWLLLLAISACATCALSLSCPSDCNCGASDELDFLCRVARANVTYNARTNEYVSIRCMGTDFTCSDLPVFNFANNITLPSLGVTGCSPSILRCVPQALTASSVTTVVMTNITEPLAEDDVKGLGDVHTFMIRIGSEKYIPSGAINALPTLRNLRISSTSLTLQSNAFVQSPPLKSLELSMDKITELPDDAFNGLSELETLYVWGNNFSTVGVNALRGLDSLKRLSLNTNQLSSLAAGSFAHVPRLQAVSLYGNRLDRLPVGVLHNLTELQNITIQSNKIQLILDSGSLSNLPSLENLHLEYSKITSLPEDLLNGDEALITLGLAHNEISSLPQRFFSDLKSLEYLDLSFNKIELLQSGLFASLKKLKTLNLNRNYLTILPDFLFSGLRQLNYVSMDHNSLHTISTNAFQGAIGLQTISLKSNQLTLTSPDREYVNLEEYSPFNTLVELKRLNLDGNHINTVFADWTMVLVKLEELSLAWNNFTVIQSLDCQFLSQNITVNLQHNKITNVVLSHPYLPPVGTLSTHEQKSKSSILLDFNPLECDCVIYNLSMRLRGAKPISAEPKFVVGNARCSSPPSLKGQIFKNVSPNDLNCDLPSEFCDNSCPICRMRPGMSDLDLTCNNIPPILPNPETFDVKSISLNLKTAPTYIGNLSVNLLNLTNIGLQEIPFKPSKTVKTIDFSNNKLTKIPVEFLKVNTTLYLSNNPFECHCWYAEEISALQKSSLVVDLSDVTCLNGDKMLQIDVQALCSAWRAAAVASGTFIILVLIVSITSLTIYKYSHEILVYITNKGLFPCCFIEDPTEACKEYDIFVSYAHKDINYLKELLPKLEKDFGQKTCVHYRDWSVGDLIPDQINKSVEKSRRTIILLSANFLDSTFANMEFRTAHNFALKEGRTRIILIILEDVTKHDKLTDELKAYIKTNTYLTWDDPNFWNRLQRALPMRNNKKFVLPDVFKQAGAKTVKSGLDVHLNSEGKLVNVAVKDSLIPIS